MIRIRALKTDDPLWDTSNKRKPESQRGFSHNIFKLRLFWVFFTILKMNEMFLGWFIRHILIEKNGDHIGILSIGDVFRVSLIEKDRQLKSSNKIASWEYYEHWGWHRKIR